MDSPSPTPNVTAATSIWLRPGLSLPAFLADAVPTTDGARPSLDTALFDVDGVLVDTRRSYRLSVIAAAEHLVRVVNGLDAPTPMLTQQDVALFKRAGGFNSDWDATRLFAALWTARLREWRGQPAADVSLAEWAAQASAAARNGRGGLVWLHATVPASAIPSADDARWAHDEFYWGTALVREMYGHEPRYVSDAPGFVHNEELLIEHELLPSLLERGVAHFGLITGRFGPEVGMALRHIVEGCAEGIIEWHESEHGRSPFASIVSSTLYIKPDPRALTHAVRQLGSCAALYTGDTADDLDLVLRYRREAQPNDAALPPVLAVMVANGEEVAIYQQRGADIIIPHIRQLPAALSLL